MSPHEHSFSIWPLAETPNTAAFTTVLGKSLEACSGLRRLLTRDAPVQSAISLRNHDVIPLRCFSSSVSGWAKDAKGRKHAVSFNVDARTKARVRDLRVYKEHGIAMLRVRRT
jgi:hypothetical protein